MKPKNIGKLWTYFEPETIKNPGFLFAFFNEGNKRESLYIYTKDPIEELNIPDAIKNACIEVYPDEEEDMLAKFTTEEYAEYDRVLIDNGLFGYQLYNLMLDETVLKEFDKMLHEEFPNSSKFVPEKYESYNNDDEYTFYIILRTDIESSISDRMIDVSCATRDISNKLEEKFQNNEISEKIYTDYLNGKINTVILQASSNELFNENFIPTEVRNPNLIFDFGMNFEEKVAHNNFRLQDSHITYLTYFGKKSEMPKFVRKFKLYGGK